MKILVSHLLPLCLCAIIGCTHGATGPTVKASDITTPETAETLPVAQKPVTTNLQKHVFQVGPFDISANTSPEEMRGKPAVITFQIDEPMWITTFEPSVEDADGNTLPGSLLHLALISNQGESNQLCDSEQIGNPFAAATSTLKKIVLPEGHGYAVMPEDQLEAKIILRNPTNEDYNGVYFKFTLVGKPMATSQMTQDVLPLLLDVNPCTHEPVAVEPGGYIKRTDRFSIPEAGNIIAAYGLLQDFGVDLSLNKEGESAPFYKAIASINADHQIVSLPTYQDSAGGVPFQSGEGVILTVSYQNYSQEWFNDATVAAIVYVARNNGTASTPTQSKPYQPKRATTPKAVQAMLLQ